MAASSAAAAAAGTPYQTYSGTVAVQRQIQEQVRGFALRMAVWKTAAAAAMWAAAAMCRQNTKQWQELGQLKPSTSQQQRRQ
jgi:hypothetical protein